ncbi:MAG: type IV conjugative transfer system coupling protein TraD [Alphaproteobacteria bacterium]|nr:type IV conjugative transfer system coupling protein TraD [Alphaproteobacteria bacterium]
MSALNFYTRGGQLAVHQFRMLKQILSISLALSLLVGIGVFLVLMHQHTTPYQRYLYKELLYAELMVNMSLNDADKAMQDFKYPDGITRQVQSKRIFNNPSIKAHISYMDKLAEQSAIQGFWAACFMVMVVIGFFIIRGYRQSLKKLERGGEIVSAEVLKRIIKKQKLASDLHLDGLPLIKNKETSHILITGTTGSGKTNCFHTLLPQIRERPNRAIVVDLTGDFVAKYYREGQDVILNPLDERTENWSPWADCLSETHYDALAAAIVPKSSSGDKFWENAGKALLSAAFRKYAKLGKRDIHKLYDLLVKADLKKFSQFFHNTEAASYTHMDGDKMTISIRATLVNHIQAFKHLSAEEEGFSIRKWVSESPEGQWLFISAKPDQRHTLLPLISGWIDTAINAVMSEEPNRARRMWFVLDELPALQKLPSLETGMAEARKYGGCFLAGVQSFPQLINTYGQNQAQSLLDLFNTKIFFRNTDPNTTSWISKVLGEAEVKEHVENLSYGANTIRDGVSLSQQTRTKPLVLATEIACLPDLEAYIKLPATVPTGRIKMKFKDVMSETKGFIAMIKPLEELPDSISELHESTNQELMLSEEHTLAEKS